MRGLICTEGNLCLKIDWASLIGLALFLYLRAISKYKPPGGAYIWRGDLTEGFLRYEFRGLIHGGAYFRNFTVDYMHLLKLCKMS